MDDKMGKVIRQPKKETKVETEKREKYVAELSEFMREKILDAIITQAVKAGESINLGKEVQKKFQTRPVKKYVYPLLQEF